jgi:SAM-dependent methyltransferase
VDYAYELSHPDDSVRRHEFAGLLAHARSLAGTGRFRWLDYGCGHGALIPWVKSRADIDIHGWDQGAITAEARRRGIPILTRAALARSKGSWDLVSAVEVLEHHPEPLAMLREIRGLLRPGGTLFLTTGNADRHKGDLLSWSYAQAPDVHICFYGPRTLGYALERAGFEVLPGAWGPGWKDIFHYKILKALGLKRDYAALNLLPWGLLGRLAERGQGLSEQPLGRRPA